MNAFKKICAVFLALSMMVGLCACGEQGDTGGTANYEVKVLDSQGKPCSTGVIVKFLKDGKQVAMQPVNANGIAAKELEKGDYTVELMFTNADETKGYDKADAVLSADKTSLELSLINELDSASEKLFANGEEHDAYRVSVGSTNVTAKASVRNYFIFTPTEAGTYKFSVSDAAIALGYYGSPFFVQTASAIDVVENTVSLSATASSLGGTYVIGLDGADVDTSCVLTIVRTGDPALTLSDIPWTEYKTTHTPTPFTLKLDDGAKLKYVDIKGETKDNEIVFNESDGLYHYQTDNGPVVLVHLGKGAPYISLQTVIEGDGLGGGAPIREYFFDGKGTAAENLIKKEDYTDILLNYFANMDENAGVYPLTADLIYIIQNGCHGWWDKDDPNFIFTDCNPEIGWMFALCYAVKG